MLTNVLQRLIVDLILPSISVHHLLSIFLEARPLSPRLSPSRRVFKTRDHRILIINYPIRGEERWIEWKLSKNIDGRKEKKRKLTSLARRDCSAGVLGFTGVTGLPVLAAVASSSRKSDRDFLLIPAHNRRIDRIIFSKVSI